VPRHYLFGRIARLANEHQPMLEAGCGSGQWVAWGSERGYQAIGVDWSEALTSRAAAQYPRAHFVAGDLRALPLPDCSVGSIIALGSVEHTIEGPEASLPEEGLVQTFGPLAGRYAEQGVVLSPAGRLLRRLLPVGSYEHMLGYLVRKPPSG
jgi:SAM-dependent methyltransferase